MKKHSILALALSVTLFSCQKDKEVASTPTATNQATTSTVAENFVQSKYAFLESETTQADFDALFSSVEMANVLENDLESQKSNMNALGIKYTSHQSDVKIISQTKNNDASESMVIEELSIIKTNQVSQVDGGVISTTVKQRYSISISFINGGYMITELHDLDKENLEKLKKESESETLTIAEQNEINGLAMELAKVTGIYSRTKVFNYAKNYAIAPNTAYQDFSANCSYCGGDCTNFLSQCLLSGGWTQVYGKASSLSSWWYGKSTNPSGYKSGFSSVWPSAQKMGFFLKATSRTKRVTSLSLLKLADAVQLVNGVGNAYHALIVSDVSTTGNIFLSCHTSNRYNAPLSTWGLTPTTNYAGKVPFAFLFQIKDVF